jgi:FkbM family methyltransferase
MADSPTSGLVFDLGMNNGDDTAYYLSRGFDVLAVEANPALCSIAADRFADDIRAGRLTVVNVGVAEPGELEFWVSEVSEWSSFDRENAVRPGTAATPIHVATVRFGDLLWGRPVPVYIKIDIEGRDSLCIQELARLGVRPRYVSFEGHRDAVADVAALAKLGYRDFKCVRQNDWREITPENMGRQSAMRRVIARTRRVPWIGPWVADRLRDRRYRPAVRGFRVGSSGPLACELPGRWLSAEEVSDLWRHRLAVDGALSAKGLVEWFDIHAELAGGASPDSSL